MRPTLSVVAPHRVLRRLDTLPFILAGISVVGIPLAMVAGSPRTPDACAELAVLANLLVWLYIGGPAASVVVTSSAIEVNNALVRYVVPRQRVTHLDAFGGIGLRISIDDGSFVWVGAVAPGLTRASSQPERQLRKKVSRINEFLGMVPEAPSPGSVSRRFRLDTMLLFMASLISLVVTAAIALSVP